MSHPHTKHLPKTPEEWLALILLIGITFSGWPSVFLTVFNREVSIEPAMASVLLGAGFLALKHLRAIAELAWQKPWRYLTIWFITGTLLSLLHTGEHAIMLLYGIYFSAAYAVALGTIHGIQTKTIRGSWLVRCWVGVGILQAGLAIDQFLLTSFTDLSLVRDAYDIGVFSFPRVHGFALEPLFFAQLLIVPIIALIHQLTTAKHQARMTLAAYTLLMTALWLTLARSAIIAVTIGVVLLLVTYRKQLQLRSIYQVGAVSVLSLFIAMVGVGLSATANTDKTAWEGVSRYLDHASLGLFNAEGAKNVVPKEIRGDDTTYIGVEGVDDEGVVEASTFGRLEVIRDALSIYRSSPTNILYGVGKNRLGEELSKTHPDKYEPRQVANNQYVEILTETGIVGVVLLGLFVSSFITRIKKHTSPMIPAIAALAIQFMFFSNYVSFPFWLALGIVGGIMIKRSKHAEA